MEKIKVIHYIPGFDTGGIESRLIDWYSNLDREKIEFIVIKLNNNDTSDKIKEFVALGGRYYNLPSFNFRKIKSYIKKLKKILEEEKPNILHVHSLSTGIFPLIIAKNLGIKTRILHSRTTNYLPNEKNVFIKKIFRFLSPYYATDYFCCSIEAGIWGCGKRNLDKLIVINNGIDLPKFYFDKNKRDKIRSQLNIENNMVIGSISRLSTQKNIMFLIDVFYEIYKKNSDYRLILVGGGEKKYIDEIKNKISLLKLDKVIILVGNKSEVWDYYMAFDIFVGTSFYEGFGTTAIEAQATGLPTILSQGFPKVVEITNYVKRISLDENANLWAANILNIKLRKRKKEDAKIVEQAGYSAKSVANMLQKFYISKL